ncbi:MAG: hypothetical protein F6J94_18875 [Moorea sp. SIO1F2]|uniref:hypothetical protein n=1 Tax=Moorena sp. SIO1F2 TaxID=2607819 RepID=UPI0013B6C3A2|nr:hypothetical protein [Moorena sp. SIO1F2]NET83907.1 hypothetical protein [Moorena sp. SIO1F2]
MGLTQLNQKSRVSAIGNREQGTGNRRFQENGSGKDVVQTLAVRYGTGYPNTGYREN